MSKSLRLQILGLLGGSLALVLVIALACFNFLSDNVQAYRSLIDGPVVMRLSPQAVTLARVIWRSKVSTVRPASRWLVWSNNCTRAAMLSPLPSAMKPNVPFWSAQG